MTTQDTSATPTPATPTPREIFIAKKADYVAMLAKDLTFSGTDEEWSEHGDATRQAFDDLMLVRTGCTTCIIEKLSLIADRLRDNDPEPYVSLIWIAAVQADILYAKGQDG